MDVVLLMHAHDDVGSLFWPTFVLALITSVIGSQAMVSCAFATMSHLQALNCFPRVKILHTSRRYSGQLYSPEVNVFLCIAACVVTVSFRTTGFIAKAHGNNNTSAKHLCSTVPYRTLSRLYINTRRVSATACACMHAFEQRSAWSS
jgi:K+ transporter